MSTSGELFPGAGSDIAFEQPADSPSQMFDETLSQLFGESPPSASSREVEPLFDDQVNLQDLHSSAEVRAVDQPAVESQHAQPLSSDASQGEGPPNHVTGASSEDPAATQIQQSIGSGPVLDEDGFGDQAWFDLPVPQNSSVLFGSNLLEDALTQVSNGQPIENPLPSLNQPLANCIADDTTMERSAIVDPLLDQTSPRLERDQPDLTSSIDPVPGIPSAPQQGPASSYATTDFAQAPVAAMSHQASMDRRSPLQFFEARESEAVERKRNIGEPAIGEQHAEALYPLHPRPRAWGPQGATAPVFRYTSRGQWSVGTYFSTEVLRFYVSRCPRQLKIWLQTAPHSHQRQDKWDRMCRWSECPDKGHPIRPGFYRCTFDEYPQLTTSGKKDPYFVAGCLHLYCFERIFDVAKLHRRRRLMPDTRTFELEGEKNAMRLNRPPDNCVVERAFDPWVAQQPETHTVPASKWLPLRHDASLSYALTKYHIGQIFPSRLQKAQAEKNRDPDHAQVMIVTEHMGDLSALVNSVKVRAEEKTLRRVVQARDRRVVDGHDNQDQRRGRRGSCSSLTSLDSVDELLSRTSSVSTDSEDTADEEENVDEEVADKGHKIEAIVAKRRCKNKTFYKVKWGGHKETSWEPEASLRGRVSQAEIVEFLSTHSSKKHKRVKKLEHKIDQLLEVIQDQQDELKRCKKRRRNPEPEESSESEEEIKVNPERGALPIRRKVRKPAKSSRPPESEDEDDGDYEQDSDSSEYGPASAKRKRVFKRASSSVKRRKCT